MLPLGPRMSMRMSPPGRASHSHIGLVKPRGPHHCATCLTSVHVLKTRLRGAPKMRARISSCLACPAAELLPASAMPLLLGFHLSQIVLQTVKPLLPRHPVLLNPIGNLLERGG